MVPLVSGVLHDVVRWPPIQSRGGMNLPRLPSVARSRAGKGWVRLVSSLWWEHTKHCVLGCSFSPGVSEEFILLPSSQLLILLFLSRFPGFIVVLNGEEQGERDLWNLV